eukprot:860574-Pyramimonas_sp.AAC.1
MWGKLSCVRYVVCAMRCELCVESCGVSNAVYVTWCENYVVRCELCGVRHDVSTTVRAVDENPSIGNPGSESRRLPIEAWPRLSPPP